MAWIISLAFMVFSYMPAFLTPFVGERTCIMVKFTIDMNRTE